MSEIKDLISGDAKLLKFFEDKPGLGLDYKEINSEIFQILSDSKIEEKNEEKVSVTKMEERKNLLVTVLMEMAQQVKELCLEAMSAVDEHLINDESFSVNPDVRNFLTFLQTLNDEN